jgi:hypothetical protein
MQATEECIGSLVSKILGESWFEGGFLWKWCDDRTPAILKWKRIFSSEQTGYCSNKQWYS